MILNMLHISMHSVTFHAQAHTIYFLAKKMFVWSHQTSTCSHQVHEMAMVSVIQEAQKDNLRSFNDYMMTVLEEDWQKEKRDFLQSMS
ncbi:hypothetical protein ACSBR2_020135 [Camellia fascicularis]